MSRKLQAMVECKPFSWADIPAVDFGARCLYDDGGATKFIPSQIFVSGDGKFRVVLKGEIRENLGGYSIAPDEHFSDRTDASSSAVFFSEDEVLKAYYAISYAFVRKYLLWPPPSQFHEEFRAAGYIVP